MTLKFPSNIFRELVLDGKNTAMRERDTSNVIAVHLERRIETWLHLEVETTKVF